MPMEKPISRNPYHNSSGEPELKPSALIFMDILGYLAMSKEASQIGKQYEFLKNLRSALMDGRWWLEETFAKDITDKKDRFALKAFTDNVVVGYPIQDDGEIELGNAIQRAAEFQFSMAIKGFFVRGAIAVGEACVDEITVAGDALLQAYEGEAILARDPRVILTKSAIRLVKKHLNYYGNQPHAPQAHMLLQDSDGQWFVNYLDEVLIYDDERDPFYKEFMQHKREVEKKLNQHRTEPAVFAKYSWVASYHNFFCDLHKRYFSKEHKIDTELFRAKPRSILE